MCEVQKLHYQNSVTVESLTWNNMIWNIRRVELTLSMSRVGTVEYSTLRRLEYGIAVRDQYSIVRVAQNGNSKISPCIFGARWLSSGITYIPLSLIPKNSPLAVSPSVPWQLLSPQKVVLFVPRDPHRTVYGYDRKLYGRKCGPTGRNRHRKELSKALTVTVGSVLRSVTVITAVNRQTNSAKVWWLLIGQLRRKVYIQVASAMCRHCVANFEAQIFPQRETDILSSSSFRITKFGCCIYGRKVTVYGRILTVFYGLRPVKTVTVKCLPGGLTGRIRQEEESDDEEEPAEPEFKYNKKEAMAAVDFLQKIVQHRPDLDEALPLGGYLHKFRASMVHEVEEAKVQRDITSFFK
ncbi:hypothetical protein DFH09DRAFT_1072305 [Mycena vulgaris]|nr:hypothetical protein DFH09DRAFT_1072305 [Mycena vulgaris]